MGKDDQKLKNIPSYGSIELSTTSGGNEKHIWANSTHPEFKQVIDQKAKECKVGSVSSLSCKIFSRMHATL